MYIQNMLQYKRCSYVQVAILRVVFHGRVLYEQSQILPGVKVVALKTENVFNSQANSTFQCN